MLAKTSTAVSDSSEAESPKFDVDNGMESNRGGPLTTFIMTLPMIVVPTIAMLKPADNGAGLVSGLLSASQYSSSDESADDAPEFASLSDDVNSMFFEEESDHQGIYNFPNNILCESSQVIPCLFRPLFSQETSQRPSNFTLQKKGQAVLGLLRSVTSRRRRSQLLQRSRKRKRGRKSPMLRQWAGL